MAIITISRELGSNGGVIGQMILNTLHYRLVDKALIERVLQKCGSTSFTKIYDSRHNILSRFDNENKELVRLLNKTILAFAKYNNSLIIGRGGFAVLREYHNVINVLIRAPFEQRVRNAMVSEGIGDLVIAENTVRQNDRVRESFLQTFYDVPADSTQYFNIVVDTNRVPVSLAGRWIIEAAKAVDQQIIKPENNSLNAEVDPIIRKIVAELLSESEIS